MDRLVFDFYGTMTFRNKNVLTYFCLDFSRKFYKYFIEEISDFLFRKIIIINWGILIWPPHAKSWLTGKDPGAGRDWGQEEKGTTEDERAGWHHQLDGYEFEWTPGVGDGQEGLVVIHGVSKSRTWLSDWTELNY